MGRVVNSGWAFDCSRLHTPTGARDGRFRSRIDEVADLFRSPRVGSSAREETRQWIRADHVRSEH